MQPDDVTAPRRARAKDRPRTASIRVLSVPGEPPERARVTLDRTPLVVGRNPGPEGLTLPDPVVSRRHATLTLRGHTLEVLDESRDGTYVAGERVTRAEVADGAVVRMGDSFLLFRLDDPGSGDAEVEGLLGDAPAIRALRALVAELAPDPSSVLVLGASGTGKELVALGLHELSEREGRFVAINCAAIPEHLADSTLFGHVRGAFTGAQSAHPGVFQQAEGGTLFLDEIAEASPSVQAKLLRAIETRSVLPVGATAEVRCDVRIVAATLSDLERAIERGAFRGDLYARLADVIVEVPPLKERREDILPLLASMLAPKVPRLDPDLVAALLDHPWPYNVRELKKIASELRVRGASHAVLEHALVASRLPARSSSDSEAPVTPSASASAPKSAPAPPRSAPPPESLAALFAEHGGNVSRIARALGYSRRHAKRLLDEQGLR